MANECESVSIKYRGNGTQKLFTFPFTYMDYKDVVVFLYDEEYKKWENQAAKFIFANATTVEFLTAPPTPVTADLKNIWITRRTDLEQMLSTFYPGSSIRAQDLNDDFDQLRLAIQESRCSIQDLQEALNPDVIDRPDQEAGFWQGSGDQQLLATSGAIAARHDTYVRESTPLPVQVEQPGKGWQNTDYCWSSYWNPDAKRWVAYVNTGPRGERGIEGPPGPVGPPGEGINVIGSVPTFDDLPTLGADDLQFWYVETENVLYFWNGVRWDNAGAPGGTGPQGDAATIEVGDTVNGAPGTAAQVTNSGTSSAAIFDFVIPEGQQGDPGADGSDGDKGDKGDKGDTGTAATISVGTTTTGSPGSDAAVTDTGTPSAAVLNFTIPRGEKGDKGDAGLGIQYKGSWDQANTAPPSPIPGDLYAWTGASNTTLTNADWGSLNGTEVDYGDRVAYTEDSDWSVIPAPDTTGVAEVTATAPVTVNNTNPARPVIGFNETGFIKEGSNVSLLANDAGYITVAEVPPGGVTSVNGKTGAVVLDNDDVGAAPKSHVGSTGTGAHGVVTTTTAGFMAPGDKTKLDGIQTGAQVNVATNLGNNRNTTSVTVTSSTGNNTTIAAATVSDAGVMTTTQVNKLNGISSGAKPGTVTSVNSLSPIVSSGGNDPTISINISLLSDLP